ncbi:hypothetical protein HPB50_012419 [Hyalomma asiaticum]|uniref:Uncharacterized protein n=1 Tax=Hyalomma asiaticum TaxID=266040 RepID=A0ACB7SVX2_HYAAI|nr:hypothetical protein HPB50_012419 [Hyalomma asiaticum]
MRRTACGAGLYGRSAIGRPLRPPPRLEAHRPLGSPHLRVAMSSMQIVPEGRTAAPCMRAADRFQRSLILLLLCAFYKPARGGSACVLSLWRNADPSPYGSLERKGPTTAPQ